MKRVRIIYKGTVAAAPAATKEPETSNAEMLAKLLNDVLNAPAPEAAPTEPKQEAAHQKDSPIPEIKQMALGADVANLCSKHNAIVDQVARVMNMDDADFVPGKAILLARTLVKARLEGVMLLGKLVKTDGDAVSGMIMSVQNVISQYMKMSADLDGRFLAYFGLELEDTESEDGDSNGPGDEDSKDSEDTDGDDDGDAEAAPTAEVAQLLAEIQALQEKANKIIGH